MTYKRPALAALKETDLFEAGRVLEIEVVARMSVEELRDALGRSKRATLAKILPLLGRDSLKDVCAELGLAINGRDKQGIIERILGTTVGESDEEGDAAVDGDGRRDGGQTMSAPKAPGSVARNIRALCCRPEATCPSRDTAARAAARDRLDALAGGRTAQAEAGVAGGLTVEGHPVV